ncbi:MAG: DegV family protein, partial [Chloroflexota bacterium]|nr:DegV family protein [Chloroflexota bacterium]
MIKIVTDSSVDFTPEMARDLDVTVVPLSITFGDKSYLDGSDIDAATLYRMLRDEHAHPRTAQPSVGLFEEAFRRLAAEGHDIVVITLASALSGTYNSAALAARNVPEARVTLIDSHGISMAMGSMVIDAVHMAREGKTAAEIEAAVQALIPRLELLLM